MHTLLYDNENGLKMSYEPQHGCISHRQLGENGNGYKRIFYKIPRQMHTHTDINAVIHIPTWSKFTVRRNKWLGYILLLDPNGGLCEIVHLAINHHFHNKEFSNISFEISMK